VYYIIYIFISRKQKREIPQGPIHIKKTEERDTSRAYFSLSADEE